MDCLKKIECNTNFGEGLDDEDDEEEYLLRRDPDELLLLLDDRLREAFFLSKLLR